MRHLPLLLPLLLLPALAQQASDKDIPQKQAPRQEPRPLLSGPKVLVCVANFTYQKGLDTQGQWVDLSLSRPRLDAQDVCGIPPQDQAKALAKEGLAGWTNEDGDLVVVLHNVQGKDDLTRRLRGVLDPYLRRLGPERAKSVPLLFYYSGHGHQAQSAMGQLIATSWDGQGPPAVDEVVDIKELVEWLQDMGLGLVALSIDACRVINAQGNYLPTIGKDGSRGSGLKEGEHDKGNLAKELPRSGPNITPVLVHYSTPLGAKAQDAPWYAQSLGGLLRQPGWEIQALFNEVGIRVQAASNYMQMPWLNTPGLPVYWFPAGPGPQPAASAGATRVQGPPRPSMGATAALQRAQAQERVEQQLTAREAQVRKEAAEALADRRECLKATSAAQRAACEPHMRAFVQSYAAVQLQCQDPHIGDCSRSLSPIEGVDKVQAWLKASPEPDPTVAGLKWVRIPAGEGVAGNDSGGPYGDEDPRIRVKFSQDFYMLETEVTNAQYAAVEKGHPLQNNKPVVEVSWTEARDYCLAIGGHLPTELEWEYAARAGSKGDYGLNAKGKEITTKNLSAYAVFGTGALADARSKLPNRWGLYDMYGNAGEWVADGYDSDAYGQLLAYYGDSDREGMSVNGSDMYKHVSGGTPDSRVDRGGSFGDEARVLRSGDRGRNGHTLTYGDRGFRCVTSAPQP